MKIQILTIEETAKRFGCTIEQIKAQYAANAAQMEKMHAKAVATRKKVNGFTAEYLAAKVAEFKVLAA